ncbi:hypothetical protein B0H13DRAFT_1869097 [Mycena leptocephala]|nr:hypothetical protein B0H13DRAFT_1869097 [Mycena leptocephala]
MSAPRALTSKLKAVTRLRCEIFQTSYNPQNLRTGAKYLRARLRGPPWSTTTLQLYIWPRLHGSSPKWASWTPKSNSGWQMSRQEAERQGDAEKAKTKADSRRAAKKR